MNILSTKFCDHPRKPHLIWCFCLLLSTLTFTASAQSGSVFRDFNGNGTQDVNEPLVSGITVNAYLANGTTPCRTAVTSGSATPNYSLAGCGTAAVRVEFVLPMSGFCAQTGIDYPSFVGSANGTSVQFAAGNSTAVNFAIHNPGDYNKGTTNVSAFIPCYVSGDPLPANSDAGTRDWFVGFPYTNSSGTSSKPTQILNGAVIGTTWGVAYSKQAKKIFTSALLKRHVGLGKLGSGGIYMLTPTASSFNVVEFYDMDANDHRTRAAASAPVYGDETSFVIAADNSTVTYLGTNDALTGKPSGLGVIGTNAQRGLNTDPIIPTYDPAAFDQIGKVGLGDIDISDDGKYLFVMNLYSRKVFRLELNDASNPTAVVSVTSYDVPATTCTNGEYRPWGLTFFRNKLYVGVVCSGENGGTAATLNASVYELNNPTTSPTFNTSSLVTVPLNYDRAGDVWEAWTNNSRISGVTDDKYPQPILSDIEFTDRGDLVMTFMDRGGNQWGFRNRNYLETNTTSISYRSHGDILIAGLNCTTGGFTLENNGTVNSINGSVLTGTSAGDQGPGGNEFFNDDSKVDPHSEIVMGASAVIKGLGEILLPAYGLTSESDDAGVFRLSTTNGDYVANSAYALYNASNLGTTGKANGLGDVELTGIEAPIEIGNRVWNDTDNDGIQDAGEAGISGVQVQLCLASAPTTPIATATTDDNGNYYFSSGSGTTTASTRYSVTALTANTAYQLKFPTTNAGKGISTAKAGGNSAIDSDAPTTGIVAFTTSSLGANDPTFDVGYAIIPCSLTATATAGMCNTATNTYSSTVVVRVTNTNTGGLLTITDGAISQTLNVGANLSSFTGTAVFNGLPSNGSSRLVSASLAGCSSQTTTYNAPVSCSVCTLSITTSTLPAGQVGAAYNQTIQTTGGTAPVTFTISAGTLPAGLSLSAARVISGTPTSAAPASFTVRLTDSKSCSAALPYTISVVTASLGDYVFEDVNKDGLQNAGDIPISGAVVTLLLNGSAVATTTTSTSGLYSFTGLTPGVPYSVSFATPTGFSVSTSANVGSDDALDSDAINGLTGSYTLSAGENNRTIDAGFVRLAPPTPRLILAKLVRKGKAKLGEVISYTVVLINTGPVTATSVVVNDVFTRGLNLAPGSVSVSTGSFTPGLQGGTWAIASLPVGTTATLTYSASITAEGVIYNTATIPGTEVQVCTTVPFSVCRGRPFSIALSAASGYNRYQWYYTAPNSTSATLVADGTLNSFTATLAGEYQVTVEAGLGGPCTQLACCPILIEEVEVPLFTAMGKNPTCVGTSPQANGEITLINLGVTPTAYVYQVSAGSSFSASTAVPAQPVPVPANGLVGTGLAGGNYTVRVWVLIDGQPSCPRDVTVTLVANCACPEEICVPITIRKFTRVTQ